MFSLVQLRVVATAACAGSFTNAVGLDAPYSWFPSLVAVWLLIGVAISFRKGPTQQVAADLNGSEAKSIVP